MRVARPGGWDSQSNQIGPSVPGQFQWELGTQCHLDKSQSLLSLKPKGFNKQGC